MTQTGPVGYIESDRSDGGDHGSRSLRWLGPGRPRPAAALLLVSAAVMTFLANAVWLGRSLSTLPSGQLAALELAPVLSGAVVTAGLAVFVLGGSPVSRVAGILASVCGLVPLVLPFVVLGASPEDLGPSAAPLLVAVALHVATVGALLLPPRG